MIERTTELDRESKHRLPDEEQDARARFLNNLALLSANFSKNCVAMAICVHTDKPSSLFVASNETDPKKVTLRDYLDSLRGLLTKSSSEHHQVVIKKDVQVHVYVRVAQPLQKKCRKFCNEVTDRLECENNLQNAPKEYQAAYAELKEAMKETVPISSLAVVSSLAATFTKSALFPEYFLPQSPTWRRLRKIGQYHRAIDNLIKCALDGKYKAIFQSIEIHQLPSCVEVDIKLRPLAEVIKEVSTVNYTYVIESEARVGRYRENATVTQHAELLIAEHLAKIPHHYAYIGISKLCCYLCHQVLSRWPEKRFSKSATHGKMAPDWLAPGSLPKKVLDEIKEEMLVNIRTALNAHQAFLIDSEQDSIDSAFLFDNEDVDNTIADKDDPRWNLVSDNLP